MSRAWGFPDQSEANALRRQVVAWTRGHAEDLLGTRWTKSAKALFSYVPRCWIGFVLATRFIVNLWALQIGQLIGTHTRRCPAWIFSSQGPVDNGESRCACTDSSRISVCLSPLTTVSTFDVEKLGRPDVVTLGITCDNPKNTRHCSFCHECSVHHSSSGLSTTTLFTFYSMYRLPPTAMETVVVKLGGAAITDKSKADTLAPNIQALVARIAQVYRDKLRPLGKHLILIHGAGSFGHPPAKKYKVKAGWSSPSGTPRDELKDHLRPEEQRRDEVKFGMALTRQRVLQLHHHMLQLLQDQGRLPVLSVSTYDTVETDQGVLTQAASSRLISRVQNLLTQGFVPLLFGDAVLDHAWGATILSGDALMHQLATHVPGVQRCVFVTDVPGIFTQDPKQYADAVLIRQLHFSESGDTATYEDDAASSVDDVTGAMRTKWQWAKRIMTDAHQVNRVIICQASLSDKALSLVGQHEANGLADGDGSDAWTTILR